MSFDIEKAFDYENGFYLTSGVQRFSKLVAHLDFFRQTSDLRGEIVECGVFKGASLSRLIKFRSLLENTWSRKIIAFDVFGEFPEAGDEDASERDSFVREAGPQGLSRDELMAYFRNLDLDENVQLVEGDVCTTAPAYCDEHPELRISLLNIDVDLYEPTLACLKAFIPRVVPGGVIILDDYGVFPGATRAVDEFFAATSPTIQRLPYSTSISYVELPRGTQGSELT